jgi:hypothetical protein
MGEKFFRRLPRLFPCLALVLCFSTAQLAYADCLLAVCGETFTSAGDLFLRHAESFNGPGKEWKFFWDDDTWVPYDMTDRLYTSGMELSQAVYKREGEDVVVFRRGLRQNLYQPTYNYQADLPWKSIDTVDIAPNKDIPYAGAIFINLEKEIRRIAGGRESVEIFRFDVGLMGPSSYGAQSQKIAHNALNQRYYEWTPQQPDDVYLQYGYTRIPSPLVAIGGSGTHNFFDLSWPIIKANIGTVFDDLAPIGLRIRLGMIPAHERGECEKCEARFALYLSGELNPRWVVYNGEVQGGLTRNLLAPGTEIFHPVAEQWVRQSVMGVHLIKGKWGIEYAFTQESGIIQPGPNWWIYRETSWLNHKWGSFIYTTRNF